MQIEQNRGQAKKESHRPAFAFEFCYKYRSLKLCYPGEIIFKIICQKETYPTKGRNEEI